jgi:hypothetical protein
MNFKIISVFYITLKQDVFAPAGPLVAAVGAGSLQQSFKIILLSLTLPLP